MTKRAARSVITLGALLAVLGGWFVANTLRDPVGPQPTGGFDAARSRAAYETSSACLPCHADHGTSWGRTFHRTMTQNAGRASIRAPFDGRTFEVLGFGVRPWRKGDAFFLDLPDPGSDRIVTHRIDRVTGSRRMQQFETRVDDRYIRLPVAWSIDDQRWLHLSEAFFHPDGDDFHANRAVWDLNCIFCHTTRPVPGLDAGERLASHAAELGIACEACHGPGGEHARRMRSPLRRYAMRWARSSDPTIVNPKSLTQARSVQVCGHCHGQRLPVDRESIRDILSHGDPYTPGEDLSRIYEPVGQETVLGSYSFATRFWADGSPRLTAYEYQGLLESPCYRRGTMTCLSCHTMHGGDPRGQLRADVPDNAMCTQCHDGYDGRRLESHTHHRAESTGSRCVACHMPPVVYGIMTWHPTHLITSPNPAEAVARGSPDACTVCHSGRSRPWAASWARRYWPRPSGEAGVTLDAHGDTAPEMVRALFAGDAVYRTLSAFRMGQPSPDPAVAERAVPLLAELLIDPYPNVRRTARESIARLTGRTDLPGALDPVAARDAARRAIQGSAAHPGFLLGWPFTATGEPDRTRLAEWRHERREVDVSIGE